MGGDHGPATFEEECNAKFSTCRSAVGKDGVSVPMMVFPSHLREASRKWGVKGTPENVHGACRYESFRISLSAGVDDLEGLKIKCTWTCIHADFKPIGPLEAWKFHLKLGSIRDGQRWNSVGRIVTIIDFINERLCTMVAACAPSVGRSPYVLPVVMT
jgi:hypothetical protein